MQASLEAEAKGKAEALRMKKKLEADINELEIALDHANKANAEAQKNIKRYQAQLKDVQTALEEEQRARDDAREQLGISERRANALQNELEESRTLLEQADRGRRQAEQVRTHYAFRTIYEFCVSHSRIKQFFNALLQRL